MLLRTLKPRMNAAPRIRLSEMTAQLSNGFANGAINGAVNSSNVHGVSLTEIPKTNLFTSKLPADEKNTEHHKSQHK